LRFETQIATPQQGAILTLSQGDVLQVALVPSGGAQVVAVLKNGQLIGGLAGGLVNRLRECLLSGNQFKATVLTINNGQVRVEIEPV
jgi:molybdopterin-binding protein